MKEPFFLWGGGKGDMEDKNKSGGGDVRAIAEIITAHGGLMGGAFHLWILATTDPLRGSFPWLRLACMEFFTICHLRRHFGGYRWERWWGINGIGQRGAT